METPTALVTSHYLVTSYLKRITYGYFCVICKFMRFTLDALTKSLTEQGLAEVLTEWGVQFAKKD